MFYFVDDWQLNWLILGVGPAVVIMIMSFVVLRETPQFLIKQGIDKAVTKLNEIAQINGKEACVTDKDVQDVIDYQMTLEYDSQAVNVLDLFRFSSLRLTTIFLLILGFLSYALYYAPTLLIDQFGFNIYINNAIVTIGDGLTYIPMYFYISVIPRKTTSIVVYAITTFLSLILVFLIKPENC